MYKYRIFFSLLIASRSIQCSAAFEQVPKEYILHSFSDPHGRPKVTFSNRGDAKFSGTLVSEAGRSSLEELQIKKELIVIGDAAVRKLTVTSHIDASTMDVKAKVNAARIEASAIITHDLSSTSMRINGVLNVTSDSSINGQVTVGALTSRGRVEARSIIAANEIKSQAIEILGLVRSKDIEVNNSVKVFGQLHSLDASFQGDVYVGKKMKINEAEVKTMSVTGSVDIAGKLNSKQMYVTGDANMTGTVFMNDLRTRELKVEGKASLSSLSTDSLHGGDLNVVGSAFMRNAKFDGDIACRALQVTNNSTMSSLLASHMRVARELIVDGSFMSNGDVLAQGTVSAPKVNVDQALTTKLLYVQDTLKCGMVISDGDIETRKSLIANSLFVKDKSTIETLDAKTMNVSTFIECQQFKAKEVHADTVNTTNLHVGGNITCNAGMQTRSFEASTSTMGTLTVNGTVEVMGLVKIWSNISVSSNIESETADISKTLTCTDLKAMKSIRSHSVSIEDGLYFGDHTEQQSLRLKAGSVYVSTNMGVEGVVTMKGLTAKGPITTEIITVSNELNVSGKFCVGNCDVIIANDTITILSGSVHAHTIQSSDLMVSRREMISLNITALNAVSSPSIFSRELISEAITSNKVSADDALLNTANITGSLLVNSLAVNNDVKSKSMFSSRIYTQDVSASGFITADTVINKGDMKVHGKAEVNEITVSSVLTSTVAKITQSLECTGGVTVLGTVDAVGLTTRKATVNGDLLINGVNVAQALHEVELLRERLVKLEDFVNILKQKLDQIDLARADEE